MKKSIEALERIETMFPLNKEEKANYYNQFTSSIQPFYEDFDLVKQDLERLEQLENNIKLNETQIDDLTLEVANYKHALEEKNEIIFDLQKENQELKEQLELEKFDWFIVLNNKLDRYKKAIDILSNYICVRNPLDEENTYYLSALFSNEEIDKQTHDLLKEVLE